jgi:hypothetical protein
MYPKLRHMLGGIGYDFIAQDNAQVILEDRQHELEKLGEGGIAIKDPIIKGTKSESNFNFDISYKNNIDLTLQIIDLPGAYYTENDGIKAQEKLKDSDVSFWCIDAVALMEANGKYHETINHPVAISDCYLKNKWNQTHSICITLMRTETYEQDNKISELFRRFKSQYSEALASISSKPETFDIFYCSVQTTGIVRFNRYEDGNFIFNRHSGLEYKSQGCESPVLLAIQQSLNKGKTSELRNLRKIVNDYMPFTRWFPFLPGHKEYKERIARAERLKGMLEKVSNNLNEQMQPKNSQRFFKWG